MKVLLLSALASIACATDLLIPLYSPPGPDWAPVEAAVAVPGAPNSTIVINPANGPTWPPGDDYKAGTRNLTRNSNVQVLGYVHTGNLINGNLVRCNRTITEVEADITTWSQWNSVAGGELKIHGIFIDEAPDGQAGNDCLEYMQTLTTYIKTNTTLNFTQPPIVVYNPGDPGSGGLPKYYALNPGPDLILAIETCFTLPQYAIPGGPGVTDGCGSGYVPYDSMGYNSTINTYFPFDVHAENYNRTAIVVHGFHNDNGNLSANATTLRQEIQTIVDSRVGALFFNTLEYMTFSTGPADIGTVAADLTAANAATPSKRENIESSVGKILRFLSAGGA